MIDKNEKLKNYSERQLYWTTQALTQFGYSINFFLTIGVSMLAYMISQKKSYYPIAFDFGSSIDWSTTTYLIIIITQLMSILSGFISITSRLCDLRLTRHIIWVRKNTLKNIDKLLPDASINLKHNNDVVILWNSLRGKYNIKQNFISANYSEISNDFSILQNQTERLGKLSWKMHIFQITFFAFSIIIYALLFITIK